MSEAERATTALLELMARLRDPERGCPWDRQQSFASIAPFTIEEAYEVADAIERNDPQQIRDELGDLLFQIVFHCRMAQERGWFEFSDVAAAIHAKLVRRHPHVFADAKFDDPQVQTRHWEELKARERAESAARRGSDASTLADVPKALPALVRAAKLGRRAARVGFDWQEPGQVREKVLEELGEVDEALASGSAERLSEELGDLLFAITNWSLHLNIEAEEALRAANTKFETRFRRMEALASAAGTELETLSAAQWDALWRQAKEA
jgi:nucleoside triphosphate diphosphatase